MSRGQRGYNYGYGNRGRDYSAGALVGSDVALAEEGHPEVEVARGDHDNSGLGAMQFGLDVLDLSDQQLERIVGIGEDEKIGAIFVVDSQ